MKRIIACFVFAVICILPSNAAKRVFQNVSHGEIDQMALSPNGRYLVCGLNGDGIDLWDAQRGKFIKNLSNSFVHADISMPMNESPLMWSQDGKELFTSVNSEAPTKKDPFHEAYSVRVRAMPSGKIIRTFPNLRPPLWTDGKIIRVTDGKTIRTWRISDGALLYGHVMQLPAAAKKPPSPYQYVNFFAFSRNGRYLGYGSRLGNAHMCVWDTETGKLIHQINDEYSVGGMPAISDDGRFLVSQGEDPNWTSPPPECNTPACYNHILKLQLWDFEKEKVIRSWPGFQSNNNVSMFLKFSRDGKRIFASDSYFSHIYDVSTGKVRDADVSGNQAISNDDQFWANEYNGSPRITSTSTGKIIRIMRE